MGGQNRIVVDYGDYEGLVLLGAFETKSGVEISRDELEKLDGFEIVTTYKTWGEGYDLLKEEISNDREGYVIRFKNGFRMKIKGDEYVRLHKILTNISNRDIWEYLKEGKPLDELLEKVPDEFYNWVKDTVSDLQNKFDTIKNNVELEFKELINKKEFAEKIIENPNKSFLFKRLDSYSNQLNDMIWDSIYPTYSKPFKNESES
jgi:RNA ligase